MSETANSAKKVSGTSSEELDAGRRSCRAAAKKFYQNSLWVMGNMPGDEKTGCFCVLHHLMRVLDMLDLSSVDGETLDVWQEVHDDLKQALQGSSPSPELIALADTVNRFGIPEKFVFDPLVAADTWICNRRHQTFDQLQQFAGQIGGSTLAAAVTIVGVRPGADFHARAIEAGKAMMLTRLLANCVADANRGSLFLAEEDLGECEVDVHRLQLRQAGKSVTWLVRLYASRIEKIFNAGGELIHDLDFDAARSFKSLMTMHWKMLNQLRVDPELILRTDSPLSTSDLLRLRARHLLGLEGNASILPATNHNGHH
jgi:phytoene/squalene synthetase